jgi:acetyl esterase/lipase
MLSKMKNATMLILCLILLFVQEARAEKMPVYSDEEIKQHLMYPDVLIDTVQIVSGDGVADFELRMNIYKPLNSEGKTPLAIYIHGGGGAYNNASGARLWNPLAFSLVKQGVSVATIGYRNWMSNLFPSALHDMKGAIRFLKANAEKYGIDPEKIIILGNSMGGFAASLLAATSGVKNYKGYADTIDLEGAVGGNTEYSSEIQAAVIYYPFTNVLYGVNDFDPALRDPDEGDSTQFLPMCDIDGKLSQDGMTLKRLRQEYERYSDGNYSASPYVKELDLLMSSSSQMNILARSPTALMPEVLIIFGKKDVVIPVNQGKRLMDAYTKKSFSALLLNDSLAGHGKQNDYIELAAVDFCLGHFGIK